MSEYKRKTRDIISNEQKKLFLMSIRDEVNCDIVSVSFDESNGYLGRNRSISFLFIPKNSLLIYLQPPILNIIQWIPMIRKIKMTNWVPPMMKK